MGGTCLRKVRGLLMVFWLIALAAVVFIAVVLFVVKRAVPACRRSRGLDAFWAANKRRSRVVVTVRDDDMPCGVDALNVEGVVKSAAVQHGELTICMLGVPDESGTHSVVQFSFNMKDVQDFSVGERPMLHRLEWREREGGNQGGEEAREGVHVLFSLRFLVVDVEKPKAAT